jgi:xylan 1,4-beta-xylosidase
MSTDTSSAHVSRRRLGPFPPAAPSNPDAPHVVRARVDVDAAAGQGPLTRVWESFGYD